jgi:hypothetical protein
VSTDPGQLHHLQADSYDTDSLIGMLDQLKGFYAGQQVVLLWDGLSAHWSYKMRSQLSPPATDAEAGSTFIARRHGWPSPGNASRMGRPDGMRAQWSRVMDATSRREGTGIWLLGVQ